MQRKDMLRVYERYYNPTLAVMFDAARCPVEARARGITVFDESGEQYLDFAAGYGVFSIGHVNERVQAAVQQQLYTLATAPCLLYSNPAADLMGKLARLLPGDLNRFFLVSSGSEATEVALRTALLARPERTRLVAAADGYHGKTLGALGVMGQDGLRRPFEPLWRDVRFVTYGDVDAMANAIGDGAAAIILEPVQGGGYLKVPPDGYLAEARRLCDRSGTLLIIDEIQTGFGRTGKMFAFEHDGIVPDIVLLSKGITGGHTPIAVAAIRESIAQQIGYAYMLDPFAYGSDSGGSPLVCAAASAAIDFIVEADLPRRAGALGMYLQQRLRDAVEPYPRLVLEVPGRGLMTGTKMRNCLLENALWLQLLKRKVITGLSTNSYVSTPVLRFFPPLIVEHRDIDIVSEALHDSLEELNRLPSLLVDLANEALRVIQYSIPRSLLCWLSSMLS